jgi:hypothetical protein
VKQVTLTVKFELSAKDMRLLMKDRESFNAKLRRAITGHIIATDASDNVYKMLAYNASRFEDFTVTTEVTEVTEAKEEGK